MWSKIINSAPVKYTLGLLLVAVVVVVFWLRYRLLSHRLAELQLRFEAVSDKHRLTLNAYNRAVHRAEAVDQHRVEVQRVYDEYEHTRSELDSVSAKYINLSDQHLAEAVNFVFGKGVQP